jgi:hypothetical protein
MEEIYVCEYFVPFDIAKRLKELGFHGDNHRWYDQDGNSEEVGIDDGFNPEIYEDLIPCPTLDLALDWFEKKYRCYVQILHYNSNMCPNCWYIFAYNKHNPTVADTKEKAKLDAITFILDNLDDVIETLDKYWEGDKHYPYKI